MEATHPCGSRGQGSARRGGRRVEWRPLVSTRGVGRVTSWPSDSAALHECVDLEGISTSASSCGEWIGCTRHKAARPHPAQHPPAHSFCPLRPLHLRPTPPLPSQLLPCIPSPPDSSPPLLTPPLLSSPTDALPYHSSSRLPTAPHHHYPPILSSLPFPFPRLLYPLQQAWRACSPLGARGLLLFE